jgi:uncharacterized protein (TIGR02646 family)
MKALGQQFLVAHKNKDKKKKAALRKEYSLVKAILVKDFHGKCAYCESQTRHISAGQTDHVLPVSKNPDQVFVWENLVLACENCNRNKNAYDDTSEPLINPLNDDPASHLVFRGPWLYDRDTKGEITIKQLQLNRTDLYMVRLERLNKVQEMVRRVRALKDAGHIKILVGELKLEGAIDKEFSAMVAIHVSYALAGLPMAS